ncbi:MAG TPA: aminoglycoside phosphotransferase family protein [Streptosporangiaceae bacterium]|jgi:aminoglycoside phosphotransferase (APT) family kinase protein
MTGDRLVTLVVCDRDGNVLGRLDPFEVATPWWQDVEPIRDRFPALTVVRLLHGTPAADAADGAAGGQVTYLAQSDSPLPLSPATEQVSAADQPLRMPWARPGGPAADLGWAAAAAAAAGLRLDGRPMQHRTWNLSCIWSLPVHGPSGHPERLWLKCVPRFFAHEAAVLRRLSGHPVPALIAADAHRMLLAELPGRDGYQATTAEAEQIIECLVALQLQTAPLVPALLADGVPDARHDAFVRELRSVVARRAPGDPVLCRLVDEAPARLAQAQDCGLPDVLVHGDAHPGNARIGVSPPVLFDWGDAWIGNPVLDLAVLDRLPAPTAQARAAHWLRTWKQAVPGSDPERAWRLLRPLAALRFAVVYQRFLDHIEPSERIYHEQDVLPALRAAAELAAPAVDV